MHHFLHSCMYDSLTTKQWKGCQWNWHSKQTRKTGKSYEKSLNYMYYLLEQQIWFMLLTLWVLWWHACASSFLNKFLHAPCQYPRGLHFLSSITELASLPESPNNNKMHALIYLVIFNIFCCVNVARSVVDNHQPTSCLLAAFSLTVSMCNKHFWVP